jgi:hypothetical protein
MASEQEGAHQLPPQFTRAYANAGHHVDASHDLGMNDFFRCLLSYQSSVHPLFPQERILSGMKDNGLDTGKWLFYFCPRATIVHGSTLADVYFYLSTEGLPASRTTKWKSINDVLADEKGVSSAVVAPTVPQWAVLEAVDTQQVQQQPASRAMHAAAARCTLPCTHMQPRQAHAGGRQHSRQQGRAGTRRAVTAAAPHLTLLCSVAQSLRLRPSVRSCLLHQHCMCCAPCTAPQLTAPAPLLPPATGGGPTEAQRKGRSRWRAGQGKEVRRGRGQEGRLCSGQDAPPVQCRQGRCCKGRRQERRQGGGQERS